MTEKIYTNSVDADIIVDVGEYKLVFPETSAYSYNEIIELSGLPSDILPEVALSYYCEKAGIYIASIRHYPAKGGLKVI